MTQMDCGFNPFLVETGNKRDKIAHPPPSFFNVLDKEIKLVASIPGGGRTSALRKVVQVSISMFDIVQQQYTQSFGLPSLLFHSQIYFCAPKCHFPLPPYQVMHCASWSLCRTCMILLFFLSNTICHF